MKSSDRNTSDVTPKEHPPLWRVGGETFATFQEAEDAAFGIAGVPFSVERIEPKKAHEGGNLWDYLGIEHHNANLGKYD